MGRAPQKNTATRNMSVPVCRHRACNIMANYYCTSFVQGQTGHLFILHCTYKSCGLCLLYFILTMCACRNWFFTMCMIIPFPVLISHIYFPYSFILLVTGHQWGWINQCTISSYINEVRGWLLVWQQLGQHRVWSSIFTWGLSTIPVNLYCHASICLQSWA